MLLVKTFVFNTVRTVGYRDIDELQLRNVLFGGKCIRGNVTNITNDPLCNYPDVLHNRVCLQCIVF